MAQVFVNVSVGNISPAVAMALLEVLKKEESVQALNRVDQAITGLDTGLKEAGKEKLSPATTEDKPKRHRRTKAEIEAAKAAEETGVEETLSDELDEGLIEEDDTPLLDMEKDIIPAARLFAKKHGPGKLKKVLESKFGVTGIRDTPPAKHQELLDILKK